jgi:hypothetical protein
LPGADVKASGAFQGWKFGVEFTSQSKFLSREGRQANGLDQLVLLIPQDAKKVDDFAIKIVVSLDWGRETVQEDSSGSSKRLTVVMALRE